MVWYCAAYNCKEKYIKGGPSFHGFPSDPCLRQQWVNAMKRVNFIPTKYSKLCCNHFKEEDFCTSGWSSVRVLKPDAVPSLFNFPAHLVKVDKGRKPPCQRSPRGSEPAEVQEPLAGGKENEDCELLPGGCGDSSTMEFRTEASMKRKAYVGDYNEEDMSSPHTAVKFMKIANEALREKNRIVKIMRVKEKRLKSRVKNLQTLVEHLKRKRLITDDASDTLLASMPKGVQDLFERLLLGSTKKKYPEGLRSFVLTLNFYSPKAYAYVRSIFKNVLPHPRTLQKWYQAVDGRPGFTKEAIAAIEIKVRENSGIGKKTVCALMMDEMSIMQKIEWKGEKFYGFVSFGSEHNSDVASEAQHALVMMVNAINDSWKIPVGYFLIKSLGAEERGNLVRNCLEILHRAGVVVPTLTFDGASSHISMVAFLGGDLRGQPCKPWFPHPVTGVDVYVILDPSHMLKLVRNALAACKSFIDKDGGVIKWGFIEDLVKIQEMEGLHLGTKCTRRHIQWDREKMRVKLAAQTLSRSVSKALQYLRESNYSDRTSLSRPTEEFLLIFNDAFDILNSRNLLGRGFKGGITTTNKARVVERVKHITAYIHGLKDNSGNSLLHSFRWTGFIGFITALENVVRVYDGLVEKQGSLRYLLPYKVSQDHLEVFFSAVRSRGGHNNNPTALQFEAAYKRLLIHAEVNGSLSANCIEETPISILSVSSSSIERSILSKRLNFSMESEFTEDEKSPEETKLQGRDDEEEIIQIIEHDYCLQLDSLSEYVKDIIGYVAGFVVKKVSKTVKCETCKAALTSNESNSFLEIKQYSASCYKGLVKASQDVVSLCGLAEKTFRTNDKEIFIKTNVREWLATKTLERVKGTDIFINIHHHMFDEIAIGNHIPMLMKNIVLEYLKIRLHHKAEVKNQVEKKPRVRSLLTKTILFKNQ